MLQILLAGFVLGTTSSIHCVGMCGPLAMALPLGGKSRGAMLFSLTLYHGGRIVTYAAIGAVLGITARGISISGLQQWLSISLGILVITFSVYGIFSGKTIKTFRPVSKVQQKLAPVMSRLFNNPSHSSFVFLGMCNGLLPCGMVYLAIAGAISLNNISHSIGFMSFFGIGTLPALLSLSIFGLKFKAETRMVFRQISPYLMMFVGILLFCRGLNLGIPILSPKLISLPASAVSCH